MFTLAVFCWVALHYWFVRDTFAVKVVGRGVLLVTRRFCLVLLHGEALRPGMLVSSIDGGKDDFTPLFVDYPDEPAAKRQRDEAIR